MTNQGGKPQRVQSGFTLMEIIGVLTIMGILAATLLSTTTHSIDIAAAKQESTNLVSFATALQNSALRNRYIPGAVGASNWVEMTSAELGVSPFSVSTNSRNARRVLLVDPNNSLTLPYRQGTTGTGSIIPPTARLIILSTLGEAFPSNLLDGTTNDFNVIWTSPDRVLPAVHVSNPLSAWGGNGTDLLVQRIDLTSLFVHLVLWNYPPPNAPQGKYQIDYSLGQLTTNAVPANSVNTYYLRNTILSLLDNQTNAVRQVDQMLSRDTVFFYIGSVWRGTLDLGLGLGQASTNITEASYFGATFASTVAAFNASRYSMTAANGTTPPAVVNAMSDFMNAYITYATNNFPSKGPIYNAAKSTQTFMFTKMQDLFAGLPNYGNCSNAPPQ